MFHYKKLYRKRLPRLRKVLYISIVSLGLCVVLALIGVRVWYTDALMPVSQSLIDQQITIEKGATPEQIGAQLKKAKLIKNALAFEWYVRLSGVNGKLKAGTYTFRPSQGARNIALQIADGKITTKALTIFPGSTLKDIKATFIKAGFSQEEIDNALNPALYSNEPILVDKPALASLEGYLYPETFQLVNTTTLNEIIKQSLEQLQIKITPTLQVGFKNRGLTLHQALTLASIVEKEVGNPDDRRQVAQVFLKRLSMGMALGSDVTYHYAAELLGVERSPYIDSPYNTRKYEGLPPGPISNVSITSLEAVANPAPGDYLYFVAGDDGKTYYSNTLAEHEALTAKYCKKLCSTY